MGQKNNIFLNCKRLNSSKNNWKMCKTKFNVTNFFTTIMRVVVDHFQKQNQLDLWVHLIRQKGVNFEIKKNKSIRGYAILHKQDCNHNGTLQQGCHLLMIKYLSITKRSPLGPTKKWQKKKLLD